MSPETKKLVLLLAISMSVTETRGEAVETIGTAETIEIVEAVETTGAIKEGKKSKGEYPENLAWVQYIRYPITFRKKSVPVLVLLDLGSKVNAIHLTFAKELSLSIRLTDVGIQKIDGIILDTFGMVVITFSVTDKANQVRFFKKSFLIANISPKVVFGMSFLNLNSTDVNFLDRKLRWRTYIIKEALSTTKHIKLVGKKEFAAATLNLESETFVTNVMSLSFVVLPSSCSLKLDVHPFRKPQVSGLIAKKAPTKVPAEYSDFADVFSLNLHSNSPSILESMIMLSNWLMVSNHSMGLFIA